MKRTISILVIGIVALLVTLSRSQVTTIRGSSSSSSSIIEEDSLVAMITFVMDDNQINQWDSLQVMFPPSGNWRFPYGITVEGDIITHLSDTTSTLSPDKLRALFNRGCDMGTAGYDEVNSYYNGDHSKVASGTFTSLDWFDYQMSEGVRVQRDVLGLGTPRWTSWSNSSAIGYLEQRLSKYGIEFGITLFQTAAAASSNGRRPSLYYPMYSFDGADRAGTADTTGSDPPVGAQAQGLVSVLPAWHPNRYTITQTIAETSDTLSFKLAVWRAIKTKGGVVWNGHSWATWASNLQGTTGLGTPSGCMSWLNQYVKAGKIRVVTPSEFYDHFYRRKISPSANWIDNNFSDVDRSYQVPTGTAYVPDGWISWNNGGGPSIGNVRKALISNPQSGGYGGKRYVTLNWGSGATSTFGSLTSAKEWLKNQCVLWVFPPKGGNWTARMEFMAAVDSINEAGGDGVYAGDSIGVTFTAVKVSYWNNYTTGIGQRVPIYGTSLREPGGAGNEFNGPQSLKWNAAANQFGNVFTFIAANNVRRGGTAYEWVSVDASWDYPADTDILLISIWKDASLASGSVRISYPYLTFQNNSQSQN